MMRTLVAAAEPDEPARRLMHVVQAATIANAGSVTVVFQTAGNAHPVTYPVVTVGTTTIVWR
jgi:hypothetical protein